MWTDPRHVEAWFGSDGATVRVAEMDLRVDGARLVGIEVHTPDGPLQMWFTGDYREVVEQSGSCTTEVPPDGRWRSTSSPPTSHHTAPARAGAPATVLRGGDPPSA